MSASPTLAALSWRVGLSTGGVVSSSTQVPCAILSLQLADPISGTRTVQVQLDSSTVQAIAADNARIQAAITSPPQ
jgi:hypothetical protein